MVSLLKYRRSFLADTMSNVLSKKKEKKEQLHHVYNGDPSGSRMRRRGAREWIARKQHSYGGIKDASWHISRTLSRDRMHMIRGTIVSLIGPRKPPGKPNRYRFSLRCKGKTWAIKALTENRHGFNVRGTGSQSDIFFSTVFLTSPINFVDRANDAVRLSSETFEIHKVLLRDVRASIR